MSSGDVFFILAFIVLPTAILVSSVWAVVFVRRRPDRIVRDPDDRRPVATVESPSQATDSRVLATIETPGELPGVAAGSLDVPQAPDQADSEPEPLPEPDPAGSNESEQEQEIHSQETAVLQTTEDLDDVVAAVGAIDEQSSVAASEPEPESEPLPDADEIQTAPEPDEEQFETSELPVVEDRQPVADPGPQEPLPSRQRRKQSVKLLPGEPDAPRQYGRNRDIPRQVPQLNRAFRRKDKAPVDLPPEPDAETGETTSRD
jgi:hypothetical protein